MSFFCPRFNPANIAEYRGVLGFGALLVACNSSAAVRLAFNGRFLTKPDRKTRIASGLEAAAVAGVVL